MTWFIFALISIFAIAIANIYQKLAMREIESDPLAAGIFFQFLLALITGIFAFFYGFHAPPFSQFPWYFLNSAVFYAAGTFFIFKAIKEIEASELAILTAFSAIITIVGGIIFLGEPFSLQQALGTILILIAIIIVQRKTGLSGRRGMWLAIIGESFYAVAVVSDTHILKTYDAVSYTPVMSLLPGIILLLFNPRVVTKLKNYVNVAYVKNLSLYSFFYGIQAICYYVALNMGANASQMAPLFRTQIILTVILAVIFLREKEKIPLKILGAVIAAVGVILLK
jgi:transporter family protein